MATLAHKPRIHCAYDNASACCSTRYLLPVLRQILSACPPDARILDMGCGNGALTATLARAGWRVTGIDTSPSGIRIAQRTYSNVDFFRADATAPLEGFRADSFDAVISVEVIEHVPEPRQLVRNARRLLKPGGIVVFTTPYHGYLKNLVLAAAGRMDAHFTALWDGGHIKFWSRATLAHLLAESNFTNLRFYGAGRVRFLWKSMIMTGVKPA
jgi:2-polyprenyl-3-methyl-5-hydroxy-6-metoxy-1,4-benzoquinol methylase